MTTQTVTIINPLGLHARPANTFVKEANRYRSTIKLVYQEKEYNAKSIVSVLKACIKANTEVCIKADGEDETEAVEGLVASVRAGLGE